MSETRVINIRTGAAYDIYIGRAVPRKGLAGSYWGNPFKSPKDGTVEQCIEKYRAMLRKDFLYNPHLRLDLESMRGKILACWCKPGPCHGDVLVELLNEVSKR